MRERVVAATNTERGATEASALAPASDFSEVRRAQRATAAIRELVESADLHVGRAIETAPFVERCAVGVALGASDLRAIADSLASAAAAFNATRASDDGVLRELTSGYRPLRELIAAVTNALDERGTVLDRASPALARIRKQLAQAQGEARDRVSALLRSAKFAKAIQDSVVTIREGRFVVPIKAEFSGEVPGIVHDTSSSGQTLFVEPLAALDANNRLRTLRIEEEREVARVLEALSREVGKHAEVIEGNIAMLAVLDVLVAKSRVARAMQAVAPELSDESALDVREGRHPLLGERAIPQSVTLGDVRVLVISGPNMGGKTVSLKMIGLFVAMTYCGMQLPAAEGTRIGRFERLFADIGDEQSIADNASTFSAHLRRMREILDAADARTLVLIDEIGGGTEPNAGAALAIAMIEQLLQLGSCGLVTTHATELKLFAHATPGVANASVRFDPQTFAPTYHLDVGTPGQSLAFPLAIAMGLSSELIDRAEALLSSRERNYEQALADLAAVQARLATERDRVAREERHVQTLQENLRARTEALERERRSFGTRAEERLREALSGFANELARRSDRGGRAKVTPAQSELLTRVLDELHRDLGIAPEGGDEAAAQRFEPGDRVRVPSLGQEADVLADNGDTVLIAIGPMRTSVTKGDVRRLGPVRVRKQSAGAEALAASAATTAELDVRGKRFVEAEPVVDRWIDEAVLAGNSPLRLIHGKGTGLLGRGLQEYLRAHPSVKNVRYGNENEGGSGVTVFELR